MGAIAVISSGGTIALFLNSMTGSKALVGFAATVQTLFMLIGQLFIAPYVRSIRNLPKFLFKSMAAQRGIPIIIAIPLFFGIAGKWSVTIFFILYSIFWFFDGFLTVPWGELCVRALKPEMRGHMMGMQVTLGGVASMLTGLLLTWLLATPALSNHHRFAAIFALSGTILLPSLIAIHMVKDPNPIGAPEKSNTFRFYKRIPHIIKSSKLLQQALIARIPAYIGFSSVTFIVVFGAGALSLPDSSVSWLVYANIIGGLIGGLTLGEASRRFGNKTTIILCNAGVFMVLAMALLLILFPSLGYAWLFATCVLASLTGGNWLGYFNYFLDIAPGEERSVFQVLGTCVGIPFSFTGYAMGAIIDNFGYAPAFVTGGIFAVVTILLSIRLKSKKFIESM